MKDLVKVGDIVLHKTHGGEEEVIGKLISYDEQSATLVLGWPKELSPYSNAETFTFSCPEGLFRTTHAFKRRDFCKIA